MLFNTFLVKKEIGGYFQLDLNRGKEYHHNALKLNSGRYCLQYIIQAKQYKKIYIPLYICDTVIKLLETINIPYEFYSIDINFKPIFNKVIGNDECFLYVNYFGINNKNIKEVVSNYSNVIIDNAHAFFDLPYENIDTFYSARKFFGVSDGAYLYTDTYINDKLIQETSFNRMEHLLRRIDISANNGYELSKKNEYYFDNCGLHEMSVLTESLLKNINYRKYLNKRNDNFILLHEKLSKYNDLSIDITNINGPMVYPFLNSSIGDLKQKLISNKIYVASYWEDVKNRVTEISFENRLSKYLIPIPIDHRYNSKDMKFIITTMVKYL